MNNNYDRDEEAPRTEDEMIAAGYIKSSDGFWIPKSGETLEVEAEEVIQNTKLVVLLNGEQLLAQVEESFGRDTITLIDPRQVRLEGTTSDGEGSTSSVSYSYWLPLSEDRRIEIAKSYVVCITKPLDTLVESYLGEFVDG